MGPPQFAVALRHFQAGRLAEAEACCAALLAARPEDPDALHLRGVIANRQGQYGDAATLIRRALAVQDDNPSFHHNLGAALQALGQMAAAAACFEAVLRLRPQAAEAHFCLGNLLQQQGRLAAAAERYERALACRPAYPEACNNLSLTLLELGRLPEAAEQAARAVALTPGRGKYYRNLAETRRFAAGDPYFATMEALLRRDPPLPPEERVTLHFALGKAYADAEDIGRSFAHLRAGNALHRRRIAYDETETLRTFDRIKSVFTAELFQKRAGMGDPSEVPVFIIGMPRSGTTLVEQILASHPLVHGAGEREELGRAVAGLAFPECIGGWSAAALHDFGSAYVAAMRLLAPSAARITDKMPRNFLLAGLIHLALPQARIIHVRRDPVDTCLSCFSKLFVGHHPYSYELGELGRYWRAYDGLMAHWRRVLPPQVLLEVEYEAVVADLEAQARRMVAHCGLAWDSACLAFHKTPRAVRTASTAQVRQPIYASSVGRAEAYGTLLDPLMEGLASK